MGVCCDSEGAALPAFNTNDAFQQWEWSLPFSHMSMRSYREKLDAAHQESSKGEGFIYYPTF